MNPKNRPFYVFLKNMDPLLLGVVLPCVIIHLSIIVFLASVAFCSGNITGTIIGTIAGWIYRRIFGLTRNEKDSDNSPGRFGMGAIWEKFNGDEERVMRFVTSITSIVFFKTSLREMVNIATFFPVGSAYAIAEYKGCYTLTVHNEIRVPSFIEFTSSDLVGAHQDPYPFESSLFKCNDVHGMEIVATFGVWMYWSLHPETFNTYTTTHQRREVEPIEDVGCSSEIAELKKSELQRDNSDLNFKKLRNGKIYASSS